MNAKNHQKAGPKKSTFCCCSPTTEYFAKAVVNDSKFEILEPAWPRDKKHKALIGHLFKNNVAQRLTTEKSFLAYKRTLEVRFNVFHILIRVSCIIYYGLQLPAFLLENINSIREIVITPKTFQSLAILFVACPRSGVVNMVA